MKKATLIVCACLLLWTGACTSHEIRPAYFAIVERDGFVEVIWRRPAQGDMAVRLAPHLSNGWLDRRPDGMTNDGTAQTRWWRVNTGDDAARGDGVTTLDGAVLTIAGLEQTITDALVSVELTAQEPFTAVLTPKRTSLVLGVSSTTGPLLQYLRIGFHHILEGVDHLAFVLGLTLLCGFTRRLLYAVTAFTAAHTAALGMATLEMVPVRVDLIELLVAASLVLVAREALITGSGAPTLSRRCPWLVALVFGLVHGSAFAGALQEIGLPANAVLPALALFNVGVEIGQVAFIAFLFALVQGARWLLGAFGTTAGAIAVLDARKAVTVPAAYLVGGLGMALCMARSPFIARSLGL